MGWDTLERRAPGYSGRAAAARTQTVWRPGAQADPWSIGDIGILDNNQLANGPGIRFQAHKLDRLQAITYKIL